MRTVASAGAVLLVGASAALGSYYGFVIGSHQHVLLGIVFAGAALGGELLKPFAVSEMIDAFGRWSIVRGLACMLLAGVCVVYSFAAELGLAAGSRGDMAATRAAASEAARSVSSERQRAETELATLPVVRPAAQLQAEIDGLLVRPGVNGCVAIDGKVTKEVCPQVAELRSQKAVAERRDQLEAVISRTAAGPVQVVQAADPLAATVAAYAQAAGWSWTAEGLLPWLSLVPVLFLELGSALAVVVVRSVGGPAPPAPAVAEPEVVQAPPAKSSDQPRRRDRRPPNGPNSGAKVLGPAAAHLREQGKSERTIAEMLGSSKTTIHRALQAFSCESAFG